MSDFLIKDGWLKDVTHCLSPNFTERVDQDDIDLLVVHSISLPPGEYGNGFIDDLFCNRLDSDAHPYFKELEGLEVSAHALVRRDGTVTQYVSLLDKAWHAGQSSFEGREACNDFSIGIELEGLEGSTFEEAQYQTLVRLTQTLMNAFPRINTSRIVAHSDIAPGRKNDPGGGFDWDNFFKLLASSSN